MLDVSPGMVKSRSDDCLFLVIRRVQLRASWVILLEGLCYFQIVVLVEHRSVCLNGSQRGRLLLDNLLCDTSA